MLATMGFPDGTRIGAYRIIRKLAEGGMGEVYEAYNDAIALRVAIKVLHPEFVRSEIAERFNNEGRVANLINHPGLVQVFDSGIHTDSRAYLVMEYLDGETLSARMVRRDGRLTVREAVEFYQQLGAALAAAHKKGIIHRDLKPDNVMLVPDRQDTAREQAKLLDFGLAKLTDRPGTKSDVIMGTPHYMSPEQCRGAKTVTAKSDVYSLGVMLFEALAGRLPFPVEGAGELITRHLFHDPPRLAEVVAGIPERLASIVDRMLGKTAETRPTVSQFLKVLADVLADLPKASALLAEKGPGVGVRVGGGGQPEDVYKPTLATIAPPRFYLGAPELRQLIFKHLRSVSQYDAFVIDHFPQLKPRFLANMDRLARINLLSELVERSALAASLRRALPEAFAHMIVVENGDDAGRLYPLACPGRLVIGRGIDANIREQNSSVSRRHALIALSLGQVVIQLEGKHPFSVNGKKISTPIKLVAGDRIEIGKTVYRLETVFRGSGGEAEPIGDAEPVDWTMPTNVNPSSSS